jgi:hypothetical protein
LPFGYATVFAEVTANKNNQVDTSNAGTVTKVAPGEILPVSIKLSNFGGSQRVDVSITYAIFSSAGNEIYSTSETVAVETTNNFVKTIQIPYGTSPGIYEAKTSIIYAGQLVPATTQFPFTVERKIFGLFQSDFFLYGGVTALITIIAGISMFLLSRAFIKRRRATRFTSFDYSNISRDKRTFYEILSDTITSMRGRVGDEALLIASHIEGLKIDKNGRVLELTGPPSKTIALLVLEYEKILGKRVSFALRNH